MGLHWDSIGCGQVVRYKVALLSNGHFQTFFWDRLRGLHWDSIGYGQGSEVQLSLSHCHFQASQPAEPGTRVFF
jgi:hypothetical protein